jgi:subtilase family serine protease
MRIGTYRRAAIVLCSLLAIPAPAAARGGAPRFTSRATDLGATSSSRIVPVTVWLKMHDTGALEDTVQALHDPASPRFQAWASDAAIDAAHAPTAAEVATVSRFLSSAGLTVTGVGPHNLFVSARGTAAQVQAALKVELREFALGDRTFFANTAAPSLPSHVQPLVAYVGGLTNHGPRPMHVRPVVASEGRTIAPLVANPNGLFFSASCFRPAQTVTFTSADGATTARYTGNRYGQDIANDQLGSLPPCGYQPSDIQTAYHLNELYKAGLDGSGTVVAITDAFGSTTIRQDADAFSAAMGLPPVNLTIIGTATASPFDADANKAGWATETTLDVEWVHAIAPGAKILLVIAADNSDDNLFQAVATAAGVKGVVTISNSWGDVELNTFPEQRAPIDDLLKSIAARGISVNFSSGDNGDEAISLGVADADWPASSPFVTAIGGVSLSLRKNGTIDFQTAWGNNLTRIADTDALGNPPVDPVLTLGFQFGGGGGVSDVYAKPSFQRGLPGSRRLVPDISWLADPFTGVEIVFTADAAGDQSIEVIGGTSLSCPMFSGLWAIAVQNAGRKLGQAAQAVYNLPDAAITDVTSVGSRDNVTGVIHDAGGTSPEVASDLAAPLQNLPEFLSAIYNSPFSTRWFVITFGTDSTLTVGPGYDLATGLGTPNPPQFVQALRR